MVTRAVVLADTHVRDGGTTDLTAAGWEAVRGADVILHAGDVTGPAFLARLAACAPVYAVLGNNDVGLELPDTQLLELEGAAVAMVHDSGPREGRAGRLHRRFPDADIVVFGHSHIPWDEEGVSGQRLLNPGSPTQRRRQPHRTLGLLTITGGRIKAEIRIVD